MSHSKIIGYLQKVNKGMVGSSFTLNIQLLNINKRKLKDILREYQYPIK